MVMFDMRKVPIATRIHVTQVLNQVEHETGKRIPDRGNTYRKMCYSTKFNATLEQIKQHAYDLVGGKPDGKKET